MALLYRATIWRLRRVADGIGRGAFRVETITKVGYRLVGVGANTASVESGERAITPSPAFPPSRRRVLAIGAAGAALSIAGLGYWAGRPKYTQPKLPPEVASLMQRAGVAQREGTIGGDAEAVGLFRRVVEVAPSYADGWGLLALAYATHTHRIAPEEVAAMTEHANAAISRALMLDPDNGYALAAKAEIMPHMGAWLEQERLVRAAIKARPDSDLIYQTLGLTVLGYVGRSADALAALDKAIQLGGDSPHLQYARMDLLWAVGRLEEADQVIEAAFAQNPTHSLIWDRRFRLWLFTGRPAQAVAFAQDLEGRPPGIPDEHFDFLIRCGRALMSKQPEEIRAAVSLMLKSAHTGAEPAALAMQFTSFVGDLDTAFVIADAYFFGRGFDPGENSFAAIERNWVLRDDRRTFILFNVPTKNMRGDPRFSGLTRELGLDEYWARSRTLPDYKRGE
jgi:tetratricopeptide (TPR) repeat protein